MEVAVCHRTVIHESRRPSSKAYFLTTVTACSLLSFSANVRYMSSYVCRLSVTFVRPTPAIEIFGNVSTPFGTLAICDLSVKILPRSSQSNPPSGEEGLNARRVTKHSDFGPFECYISETMQDMIELTISLITNRKSHMSFRLVPNSVTLNDFERRNSPKFALFHRIR